MNHPAAEFVSSMILQLKPIIGPSLFGVNEVVCYAKQCKHGMHTVIHTELLMEMENLHNRLLARNESLPL